MKRVSLLAVLYVLIQNGAQTGKIRYEGMDQASVDTLLQGILAQRPGATYQFVDQKTFDAAPGPPSIAVVPDPQKIQAVTDAKNTLLLPGQRIDALIKALDLK